MPAVYLSIGNTDNKLSQQDWFSYVSEIRDLVRRFARKILLEGYSEPVSQYQNACFGFICDKRVVYTLKTAIAQIRIHFGQDSAAWAEVTRTRFI